MILSSAFVYCIVCVASFIGTTQANHLSRNRTAVRAPATRQRNTEIRTNAINGRRLNNEIRGTTDFDQILIDEIPTNLQNSTGRIESTNRLSNRLSDGVAPDGSSVILTPVQEGAVQSLRTMLQTGQTRGTPRLIGFLIPTNDGRTRLRLMPAYLVRGPDGRETIRLGAEHFFVNEGGRGQQVNPAGMPLNLRTIVAAARRANLLSANSTQTREQQANTASGRPPMVVLRPRTSASVDAATRARQNMALQQRRRQIAAQRQNINTGNTNAVEEVEVTINHTGPQTAEQPQTNANQERVRPFARRPSAGVQGNRRTMNNAGTVRNRQPVDRASDRRLNFLDRATGQLISEGTDMGRGRQQVTQDRRVSRPMSTNRIPQDTSANMIQNTGMEQQQDIFNSPRTVNLIGNSGSRNMPPENTEAGRKVSITINTNQEPNNNNNIQSSNNQLRDNSLAGLANRRFQNNINRNALRDHLGSGRHGLDRHDLRQSLDQMHSNSLLSSVDKQGHDHHNEPTFIASSAQQKNQATLSTLDIIPGSSGMQSNIQDIARINDQSSKKSNQPDLLNDQNLSLLQANKGSGSLTIQDVFPGLQFMGRQSNIIDSLKNKDIQTQNTLTKFKSTDPMLEHIDSHSTQVQHQTIQNTNSQPESVETLLRKVLDRLSGLNQALPNNAQPKTTTQTLNPQSAFAVNPLHNMQEQQSVVHNDHRHDTQLHHTDSQHNLIQQLQNLLQQQKANNHKPHDALQQQVDQMQQLQNPLQQPTNTEQQIQNLLQLQSNTNSQSQNVLQPQASIEQQIQHLLQLQKSTHQQTRNSLQPEANTRQHIRNGLQSELNIQQQIQNFLQQEANTPQQIPSLLQPEANTPRQIQNLLQPEANTPQQIQNLQQQEANTPQQIQKLLQAEANTPQQNLLQAEANIPQQMQNSLQPHTNTHQLLQTLLQQTNNNHQAMNHLQPHLGTNNEMQNLLQQQTHILDQFNNVIHEKTPIANDIKNTVQPQSSLLQQLETLLQPQLNPTNQMQHSMIQTPPSRTNNPFENMQIPKATNQLSLQSRLTNLLQMQQQAHQMSQNTIPQEKLLPFSQMNMNEQTLPQTVNTPKVDPLTNSLATEQNSQNDLASMLRNMLKQQTLSSKQQTVKPIQQSPDTNSPLSKSNLISPNTKSTASDIPNFQKIINIQLQNALQPQDFGLAGVPDQQRANALLPQAPGQISSTLLNNPSIVPDPSVLNSLLGQSSLRAFGQSNINMVLPNTVQTSMLGQNSLKGSNLSLKELLQRNIQQVLLQQNNQLLNNQVFGTPGFLGRNNATKSFPNNQLAPSDILNDTTVFKNQKNSPLSTTPINGSMVVTNTSTGLSVFGGIATEPTKIADPKLTVTSVPSLFGTLKPTDPTAFATFDPISGEPVKLVPTASAVVIDMKAFNNNITNAASNNASLTDITVSVTNLTINVTDFNLTNQSDILNVTDILNSTITVDSFNMTELNVTDLNMTTGAILSTEIPVTTLGGETTVSPTAIPIDVSQSTVDVLSPQRRLTNSLKKSLGIKNVDRTALKGLISNVLRDLFKQNFIDPVKGTLKSSLNYTTMFNSVKKVLLKSKDKLFRLQHRVPIPTDTIQRIVNRQQFNNEQGHLQARAMLSGSTPPSVTPYITTQPATIKQPSLVMPTTSQLIIDSIGNSIGDVIGAAKNPLQGRGLSLWLSKRRDASFVQPQMKGLTNHIVQPPGDLSVSGMAAPMGMNSLSVNLPNQQSVPSTPNPIGQNNLLNSVTALPTVMTSGPSLFNSHVTDSFLTMTTPSSNLGKILSQFVDIAIDSVKSILTSPKTNSTEINSHKNILKVEGTQTLSNGSVVTATIDNILNASITPTNITNLNMTIASETNVSIQINTTEIPSTVLNTTQVVTSSTTGSTTTTGPSTTTTLAPTTTTLPEGAFRLPDGRIITNEMLEAMNPEQAELYAEMSEM